MSVGVSAVQFTVMSGRSRRWEYRWIARATSSLPVPDSPRISTVVGVGATRTICSASSRILGFCPMMKSPSAWAWSSRSISEYLSSSSTVRLRSASRSHMNFALAPPITSVWGGFDLKIVRCTSGLPVTSMIRSSRGSAMTWARSVATGMFSWRASSSPGAHGLTSTTPRMVTVGSPENISSSDRPPLPAPMITTFVMRPRPRPAAGFRRAGLEGLRVAPREPLEGRVLGNERDLHLARGPVALLADHDVGDAVAVLGLQPVALGPVQEQDHVGILLQRARLAQVRQL